MCPGRLRVLPAPPYLPVGSAALIGALACGVLGLGDMLLGGAASFRALLTALAACLVLGLIVGAACGAIPYALSRLRVRVWMVIWVVVGLVYGVGLAVQLGAFEAIGGRYSRLGWLALSGSTALGLYLTGLAWICQPSAARPRGWAVGLRRRWRVMVVLGLAVTTSVLLLADAYAFPLTYPVAHVALRWSTQLSAVALLLVALGRIEATAARLRGSRVAVGALLVITLPVLTTVDRSDRVTLDAILQRPLVGLNVRTLRYLTDVDRDGYSSLLGGGDCAPFDGAVHPGADEIPGNGLDDNCVGGDAPSWATYDASTAVIPETPAPLNVVIITIDTLRADHTSLYGYERDTTPAIAAWAKDATRFQRAYTAGPWTSLALSSMFRGVYPRRLAWTFLWETSRGRLLRRGEETTPGERKLKVFATPIDDTHRTLSEWMSRRGLRTEAVVNDGLSDFLEPHLNVSGAWDHYEKSALRGRQPNDASVTSKARRRLEELRDGPPFLLWVHYFGPHDAPRSKDGPPRYGQGPVDLYDHTIRVTDGHVGRLLAEIDRLERPTAVILTSDHGEEFRANSRGHGANLKDTTVRVPLLVRGPGFPPGTSDTVVSLVDVLPTVLTWTGVSLPVGLDGLPLQELAGQDPSARRIVLSETWAFTRSREIRHDQVAATDRTHKLDKHLTDQSAQLRATGPDGLEINENLIDRVNRPDLFEAIDSYLDQNRRVNVSE